MLRPVRILIACVAVALCGCSSSDEPTGTGTASFRCSGDDIYATSDLDWLIGRWLTAGTTIGNPSDGYTFTRGPNGVVVENTRQVGDEDDPDVPYPTMCRYRYTSDALCVMKTDDHDVQGTVYELEYAVNRAELIDDFDNPPACDAFIARQQAKVSAGDLQYSLDLVRAQGDTLVVDDIGMARQP
jgi:hypothetical protein